MGPGVPLVGGLAEQAPVEQHLGVDAQDVPTGPTIRATARALRSAFPSTASRGSPSARSSTSAGVTSNGIPSWVRIALPLRRS